VGVKWISYRRKDELKAITAVFGLSSIRTVEELCSRLAGFANQDDLHETTRKRFAVTAYPALTNDVWFQSAGNSGIRQDRRVTA